MQTPLVDWSPTLWLLFTGALLAAGPLAWVLLRKRQAQPLTRFHAIAVLTMFITFDLVLFGAFTRLSDSGLGCPDWPGCYGKSTPAGAHVEITAAQTAQPTGPVTHSKAWIEMVHRYLATAVGALCLVLAAYAWRLRKGQQQALFNPWLATSIFVAVCVQGAFGALTVTMKLFPAIVTLHLLGGYALLALMAWQVVVSGQSCGTYPPAVGLTFKARLAIWAGLALLFVQAASGAWVSTNYAVLACAEFPKCQGLWIPQMDASGFALWRPLGLDAAGQPIALPALTAIHWIHRMLALLTAAALGMLAWRCYKQGHLQRQAVALGLLLTLQLLTGLSNVVLGWPLLAALLHTGGAAAMVAVIVWMLAATRNLAPSDSMAQRHAPGKAPAMAESAP